MSLAVVLQFFDTLGWVTGRLPPCIKYCQNDSQNDQERTSWVKKSRAQVVAISRHTVSNFRHGRLWVLKI